jgi:hypothetical protein
MMLRPYFKINKNQVSVEKNTESTIHLEVYPNPTNGKLTLRISDDNQSVLNYQVYDIQGRIIEENQFSQQHELDLSNHQNGVYLLRLMDQKGQAITKRIIVSH